ncbi:transposase [Piscirickettsia salmonis]|uniref:transposase n=1 Tax=Piscirickettsia salmonis TaxID=1238 RepID=UPI003A8018F1
MFRNDQLNVAVIAFIHTNSRNGTYNPHLHVILGEGAFNPLTSEWLSFSKLPLQLLRKKWQYYLLTMVKGNFPERKALVDQLWRKRRYLGRYFAHPMMQNRRAKRDDYKPSAALVTGHYVP